MIGKIFSIIDKHGDDLGLIWCSSSYYDEEQVLISYTDFSNVAEDETNMDEFAEWLNKNVEFKLDSEIEFERIFLEEIYII